MAQRIETTPRPLPVTSRRALLSPGALDRSRLPLTYVVLILFSVIILFPFLWLILASLKDMNQYMAIPLQWLPNPAHWDNYSAIFTVYNFGRYAFNSVWLALYSVVVATLSSAVVAYGFARLKFRGRNLLFGLVLATMLLPAQALTISLFILFKDLGWYGTFLPIIVPKLFGSAFDIFLMRQFFLGLPREIDEAARLDGCGNWRIFWRMILPQATPILIVVAIFEFLNSWKDTWGPLVYLTDDANRTLPLGLLNFTTPFGPDYPKLMAATAVALVVPVILYAFGQRYIDRGVVIADLK